MMDIQIHSRNIRMTDSLEEIAQRKLERLGRYLPNIAEVRLDLSRENTNRGDLLSVAQITIRHQRGAILRAEEAVYGDAETALNVAMDKMYRQIERFKGKQSRKGRERFSATLEELEVAEAIPSQALSTDAPLAAQEVLDDAQVMRRKEILVTMMSEGEAAEQMELLGHTFFVFFNADTQTINVIYKRHDNSYGVLIPSLG
jgi:putative sigma-54 modulation protein